MACGLAWVFVWALVPETAGLHLEAAARLARGPAATHDPARTRPATTAARGAAGMAKASGAERKQQEI